MSEGPVPWYSNIVDNDRWEDLRFPATAINPVGQVSPPSLNVDNGTLEFSAAGVEIIAFMVQMPHSWREESSIRPHLHWRKKTNGTGNVKWRFTYEFKNVGETFTDSPTTLTATDVASGITETNNALQHLLTPFGEINMEAKRASCMALCTLARIGNDDADTYSGVAQLLEFDIHYIVDSLGSAELYTKQNTAGGIGL